MNTSVIQIVHQGRVLSFSDIEAEKTLIELIREKMHISGVKEACAGGDCGACAVVLGQEVNGELQLTAVNSCIRLAHSVHGMAIWTSQDLDRVQATPHPVQEALKKAHASQCGFCTPGFSMSFFELYHRRVIQQQPVTPADVAHQLSGNLCRCTGYRPIQQAALDMTHDPAHDIDDTNVLALLHSIAPRSSTSASTYALPQTLAELVELKHTAPKAQLVAGCTDVGLWINKQHQRFEQIIDLTQVRDLKHITQHADELRIGAGVSLEDAFNAIAQDRPSVKSYTHRFAGLLVRRSGTLGGNIANGSPIGDSMPLLIALRARIVLSRHTATGVGHREIALEDFYKAYRVKDLAVDEVLSDIIIPRPHAQEWVVAYKISKRQEDDISAVTLCMRKITDHQGQLREISIGVGGVAAIPARAVTAEQALMAHGWNESGITAAQQALALAFSPLSDLRASQVYRQKMLHNLLYRAWLASTTPSTMTLEDIV